MSISERREREINEKDRETEERDGRAKQSIYKQLRGLRPQISFVVDFRPEGRSLHDPDNPRMYFVNICTFSNSSMVAYQHQQERNNFRREASLSLSFTQSLSHSLTNSQWM